MRSETTTNLEKKTAAAVEAAGGADVVERRPIRGALGKRRVWWKSGGSGGVKRQTGPICSYGGGRQARDLARVA